MEHFTINGSLFLAFAETVNYQKPNSTIYKMDESTGRFKLYQTLQNNGSFDIEYFTIGKKHFLAVDSLDSFYRGTNDSLNCLIYQWNGKQFVVIQKIPRNRKTLSFFTFFTLNGDKYLAVSDAGIPWNLKEPQRLIFIYKWTGSQFSKFQEVATEDAVGCDTFEINYETFIAFANANDSQQSAVFKWSGERFVKVQSLQTYGAHDVKSFQINGHTFLAFSPRIGKDDSFIFKWNGNKFNLFQSIPTRGAWALHPFVISGQTFLGVVKGFPLEPGTVVTKSVVYQAVGSRFVNYQEIPTYAATDMTSFEYKGDTYLAVANYGHGIAYANSSLYKWI